jgi:hypothetical protein
MVLARVDLAFADPIKPVRAKHRRDTRPRLVQIGRVEQGMGGQWGLRCGGLHCRSPSGDGKAYHALMKRKPLDDDFFVFRIVVPFAG